MDCIKKQFETLGIDHQSDTAAEEGSAPQRHPTHKHDHNKNLVLNGNLEGRSKYNHRDLHHGDHHHLSHPHRNPHRYRRSDAKMSNEEEASPSFPHHQRRPPQNHYRYSGSSKVDSELYYHNPFYYRTHRNRPNQFKSGDNTSRGFSSTDKALNGSDILYEDVDEAIISDSDIPQFHIPREPIGTRKDSIKEEDHPLYHHQPHYYHEYEPPRGRDRRPRPNTNTNIHWPHYPPPPPPLARQTTLYADGPTPEDSLSPSSTFSSPQRHFDRRPQQLKMKRFPAAAAAAAPPPPPPPQLPTEVPRSRKAALHHDDEAPPPSSPRFRRGGKEQERHSPLLFPLPAPTTTVDGGSSLVAGRGMKRSAAGWRGGKRRDAASFFPSPPLSFGGSDVPPLPDATTIDGTELSLRRGRAAGGSLSDDDGIGEFDEGVYEGGGYEYVGPDYDGEGMPAENAAGGRGGGVGGGGGGGGGPRSPGWEVSSIRTFTDGGGDSGVRGEGEDGFVRGAHGRGFFDYARAARVRRKGERVTGTAGHHPVVGSGSGGGGGGGGGHDRSGRGVSPGRRAGFEIIRGGGGWETEPEPESYLFDVEDEDVDGNVPSDWPLGRMTGFTQYLNPRGFPRDGRHVGEGRGVDKEDDRAKDKRKHRRKKHSDSNRTSTPPGLPNGPVPASTAGPLSTIRAPRTPSEVAGCALGTAAVGLCATSVKKVVAQAIRWEVEKQVQERLREEKMERRRRRARKREEKEKKWRERDRLEREAVVARRANGRPGFARRLSDRVPQRFKRAMSGPSGLSGPSVLSGPSDLNGLGGLSLGGASKIKERTGKDGLIRDDAVDDGFLGDDDLIGEGFRVGNDTEFNVKPRRGWRRGWSRSRTPEPRRPISQRPPKLPEELWRRGGGG